MLKKFLMWQGAIIVILMLVACGNDDNNEEYEGYEEVSIDLGEYLEENRENLISRIATEGEEVRIELDDEMNKFIFTILIDDIELDDENRTIYSMAFDSSFVHMEELFVGLAEEIQDETRRDYFAIRVIFVDVNEEEISSQIFTTLTPEILDIDEEDVE